MSYQKCPICGGIGTMYVPPLEGTSANGYNSPCPVCLGELIINEESGLPPSMHQSKIAHVHK